VSNNRQSNKNKNPLKKYTGGVLGKYSKGGAGGNKSLERSINKNNPGNQSYRFLTKEDSQLSLFTISSAEEKDLNKKAVKKNQELQDSEEEESNS
jgi:hypothetical protein